MGNGNLTVHTDDWRQFDLPIQLLYSDNLMFCIILNWLTFGSTWEYNLNWEFKLFS